MTQTDTPQTSLVTRFLPLLVVAALTGLFALLLLDGDRNPREIKSALIGSPVPENMALAPLIEGQEGITAQSLKTGKPIVINFFASWCIPCRAEHKNLVALKERGDVILYGIAYKDKPAAASRFLDELGDPYDRIGIDPDGFKAGIDFGISGVPESFIINGDGIITHRQWGPIITDAQLKQFVKALEAAK